MNYETYPSEIPLTADKILYFLEFYNWGEHKPVKWKLCKRNFIREPIEEEEYNLFNCPEGHPYTVLEGEVYHDGAVPDRSWLKYMVDALNEKSYNERKKVEI